MLLGSDHKNQRTENRTTEPQNTRTTEARTTESQNYRDPEDGVSENGSRKPRLEAIFGSPKSTFKEARFPMNVKRHN